MIDINMNRKADFELTAAESIFLIYSLANLIGTMTDNKGYLIYICQELMNRLMEFNQDKFDIEAITDHSLEAPEGLSYEEIIEACDVEILHQWLKDKVDSIEDREEE